MVFPPCAGADETVTVTRFAFCLKKAESPAVPYGTQPCATNKFRQASAVAGTVASVTYMAVESPT
jgi:hypothetical protein